MSHFQRKSDVRNFSCKSYLLYLLPILLSFAELLCGKVVRTVCCAVCSFSLPICWKAGTNVIFIRCSFPEKGLEDGRQGRPSWLPSPRFLCPLLPLFGIKNKSDIKRLKGMIFFSERTRREEHLLQRLLREYRDAMLDHFRGFFEQPLNAFSTFESNSSFLPPCLQ